MAHLHPARAVRLPSFLAVVVALLASTASLLAGCEGEAPEGPREPSASREIPPDELVVVGASERLSRVRDLELGPDGTVWVLNDVPPYFLAFEEGELAASFGAEGDGPNEFRAPGALVWSEDALWAFDRHALVRVAAPEPLEEYERVAIPDELGRERLVPFDEMRLSQDLSPGVVREGVRTAEGGFLLAAGRTPGPPLRMLWEAELVVLSPDGSLRPELDLAELTDRNVETEEPAEGATALLPFPLVASCGPDRRAFYDPDRNHVRVWTPDGVEAEPVALPPERRVPVDEETLFDILVSGVLSEVPSAALAVEEAQLRERFSEAYPRLREALADVFPEYVSIRCGADGAFWLQRFDPESEREGRGRDWLRLRAGSGQDGARIEEVRFPERFVPMRFAADGVYGAVLDEWDVPSVARAELARADR